MVNSPSLSPEQKDLVIHRLATRIGKDGVLRVISQQTRSQVENKKLARRWVIFFGIAAVGLALSYQTAVAAKSATPQELKQKVEEAVKFVSEKGEAAYPEISNPAGPWAWKDTYIFVVDFNGTNLAHSNPPSLTGKNIMNLKDVKGNMFGAEFVATAKSEKGKGWVEYWWPKMGGQEPALKTVYVMRVPGKDCLVGAGVYDISKEEAIKAVGE